MEGLKIPKYFIIKRDIVEKIKNGNLKPGDKIDSESMLKKKYNVSTITVRKAFTDLINEGYLIGVQGKGTFVAKKSFNRELTSLSFSHEMEEKGYILDLKVEDIKLIQNEYIADKLGLDKDAVIVKVSRTRYGNNEPMAYQTSYISEHLLSLEQARTLEEKKSFYKVLSDVGLSPSWGTETYSAKELTDSKICKIMNVKKNGAVFKVTRVIYDENDKVIEYSESYFNKDSHSVSVMIKNKGGQ